MGGSGQIAPHPSPLPDEILPIRMYFCTVTYLPTYVLVIFYCVYVLLQWSDDTFTHFSAAFI